jgi:cytoskeletal protein CcmA (bactofilin family)
MRKAILMIFMIPVGLTAQSIVGETGTNGQFVVGKSSTGVAGGPMDTTFSIDPGNNEIILGERLSAINANTLPAGNVHFIHEGGAERVNILAAPGTGFSALPQLQFFYTAGSLGNPISVAGNDTLGRINFGGYNGTLWQESAAYLDVEVDGTPGSFIPTRLRLVTRTSGGASNSMTLDSDGDLTVPGNSIHAGYVVAGAIKTVTSAYSITTSSNDQTVLANGTFIIDVHDAGAIATGKTYTIKNIGTGTITVQPNITGQLFDGASITLATGDYVTIQTDATNWYVIGGNL